MSRFLIGTIPALGHVTPGLAIARELINRGHEVKWLTNERYRSKVEATGAQLIPLQCCAWDELHLDTFFPGRGALSGVARLKFDLKHVFIDTTPQQVEELDRACTAFAPDLLIGDTAFMGVPTLAERANVPFATFGVTALTMPSRDTAPFGLGLLPSSSPLGRVRNRALTWFVDGVLFRDVMAHYNQMRVNVGLVPLRKTGFFSSAATGYLHLQATVPSFEYPRSDLAQHVHFIGPFMPSPPTEFTPPAWWADLDSGKPVVHVTQGTVSTDSSQLLVPTMRALANEEVLVVASTGGRPVESLPLAALPANVRVETFISYFHLLPKVSVVVTNGGYGGVQMTLAKGVPLVVAGNTEEKPEIAARVEWSGAGVRLKTSTPTPEAIRRAVMTVLSDERFRSNARRIQREMATFDAPTRAAELLEKLAGQRDLRPRSPALVGRERR